jgi:hypothetical protein
MRVTLQTESGIISLSEQAVLLEAITDEGYQYSITYTVDPSKAARSGALRVNISTRFTPVVQQLVPLVLNENIAVATVLQRSALQKDATRNNATGNTIAVVSDITARIPNDKTTQVTKGSFTRSDKQVSLASASQLASLNVQPALLHVDVSSQTPVNADTFSLQHEAQTLVLSGRTDPSTVGTRARTVSTPQGLLGGTFLPGQTSSTSLVRSLQQATDFATLVNPLIPVQTLTTGITTIDVQESVVLSLNSRVGQQDEFFFVLSLVKTDGTVVETLSVGVPHSRNIAAFTTPKLPPIVTISGVSQLCRTFLYVKQQDTNAVGVSVYRRSMATGFQTTDALYTFVGNFPLTVADGEKRIEDSFSNFNPVIYRVIPYGQDATSCEFTGVVSQANTKSSLSKGASFVLIVPTVQESGIQLEFKNIPVGPIALNLYREDVSVARSDTKQLVTNPILLQGQQGGVVTYTDSSVSKGHIYKYTTEFLYKTGMKTESSQVLVSFNPETSNIIDSRIENLVIDPDDIKFTIVTSFIETDETKIKSALERQGLYNLFNKDINRTRLQSLIAHKIVRQNLSTGEQEEFGLVTDPSFTDKQLGPVRNVKPLVEGTSYKYTVTSFFRSADTVLENLVVDVVNEESPSKNYSYKPSKWKHPVTLTQGNIVSKESLKAYHANDMFSFGQIGKITSIVVSLPNANPAINNATVVKINNKLLKVQWRVTGNLSKIDHFLITLEILGSRTIVGKSHNVSDSGQFSFFDVLDSGEKGSLKYFITPVYHDFSRGREVETTNTVTV